MCFKVFTVTAGLNAEVAFCCTAVQRAIKFENMLELNFNKKETSAQKQPHQFVCCLPGEKVKLSEELTLK